MNGNYKMGLLTDEQRAQVVIGNVKHKIIPQILYKYRKLNNFTESIFKDNSLFSQSQAILMILLIAELRTKETIALKKLLIIYKLEIQDLTLS
jgi:hypothetical protein